MVADDGRYQPVCLIATRNLNAGHGLDFDTLGNQFKVRPETAFTVHQHSRFALSVVADPQRGNGSVFLDACLQVVQVLAIFRQGVVTWILAVVDLDDAGIDHKLIPRTYAQVAQAFYFFVCLWHVNSPL